MSVVAFFMFDVNMILREEEKKRESWTTENTTTGNITLQTCLEKHLPKTRNHTGYGVYIWGTYLMLAATCCLSHDIFEYAAKYKDLWQFTILGGVKRMIVDFYFYRFMQSFFIIFSFVTVIIRSLRVADVYNAPVYVDYFAYLACTGAGCWTFMYFFQVLPVVGHFAIVLQRMVRDTMLFVFVFLMFTLPYIILFDKIINNNAKVCNEHFETFWESAYSTFLAQINMMNFQVYDLEGQDKAVLGIVHCIFVFTVPILLINFLIALFATSVANFTENQMIIMKLQRLCVVLAAEMRLQRLSFVRQWYEKSQRKYYHVEKGDVYIRTIEFHETAPIT